MQISPVTLVKVATMGSPESAELLRRVLYSLYGESADDDATGVDWSGVAYELFRLFLKERLVVGAPLGAPGETATAANVANQASCVRRAHEALTWIFLKTVADKELDNTT